MCCVCLLLCVHVSLGVFGSQNNSLEVLIWVLCTLHDMGVDIHLRSLAKAIHYLNCWDISLSFAIFFYLFINTSSLYRFLLLKLPECIRIVFSSMYKWKRCFTIISKNSLTSCVFSLHLPAVKFTHSLR